MDVLILAGGKSSRMGGNHKGNLKIRGEGFTERLIRVMKPHAERILLSYGKTVQQEFFACSIIRDEYPDCGPMGGLHAGLKACESDLLLVCACDMPLLDWQLYDFLLQNTGDSDVVVPLADGQIHPLAAVYRKTMLPVIESCLQEGNYRLRSALEQTNVRYVNAEAFREQLQNINTEGEYRSLIEKN